jgi:hypothetical protein
MSLDSYVFIGPTISETEARKWLEATYLPPISQGDIISLLRKKPKIIGIIDGYFERVPSVWHKEILLAMSEGVHVIGGASMGALRAAELYRFGMVGIGEVFEWYRDGKIEADDEVAVRHMPASYNYKPVSEAMVNIRKTLQVACEDNAIAPSTGERLLAIAKHTHYSERSYAHLLQQALVAGVSAEEVECLRKYLGSHAIDQKKRDAIKVLEFIVRLEKIRQPLEVDFDLHYTNVLVKLADKDFCLGTFDGIRLTADMVVNHARLESDDFIGLKARSMFNSHLLNSAKRQGISLTTEEYQKAAGRFQKSFRLETEAEMAHWMDRNHLTGTEVETFITEWALIEKMQAISALNSEGDTFAARDSYLSANDHKSVASLPQPTNHQIIRQLRLERAYEGMVATALAKEKSLLEASRLVSPLVNEERLYTCYFQEKRLAVPEDINVYATELGFTDKDIFKVELIKYYHYHEQQRSVFWTWLRDLGSKVNE